MNQVNPSSEDEVHLGRFAGKLLLRKGTEGWFSPGERAYFEELSRQGGLTVDGVNTVQNKTGANLQTLLGKTDPDLIPALYAVEGINKNPLEVFLGKLLAYFEKKGNYTIYEYVKVIRPWKNPNVYPMSLGKPLFHFLCGQYITEYARNRYALLELLEDFLRLDGVDINVLDNDGHHIFDIFEDYTMIQSDKNLPLLQLLVDYGANWDSSIRWMVSNDGYILPREEENGRPSEIPGEITPKNEGVGIGKADPYWEIYQDHRTKIGKYIDDNH